MPVVAGGHPLRALSAADGEARLLAPEWAEVSTVADPVMARANAFFALEVEWQWTALPADYARVIAASGLLRQSTLSLTLGGAYVESLRGRCAEPARRARIPHASCRPLQQMAEPRVHRACLHVCSAPSGYLLNTHLLGNGGTQPLFAAMSAARPRARTSFPSAQRSRSRAPTPELASFFPAACGAVAAFAADDTLRAALLRERAALGEAAMRLTRAAWDEAEDPSSTWCIGQHVSSLAPALAAVLLGDVESEGAQDGVALPAAAVASLVSGVAAVMARPSSSGSFIWYMRAPSRLPPAAAHCFRPARTYCSCLKKKHLAFARPVPSHARTFCSARRRFIPAQAFAAGAVARVRVGQ